MGLGWLRHGHGDVAEIRSFFRYFIAGDTPRGELADRLYKQATDKIIGLSDEAAKWLVGWV